MSENAKYRYEIVAPSGYEAVQEGEITPEQHGDVCRVLNGESLSASQAREAALATNYHSLAAIVHEAADTLGIPQGHVLERAIAVKARIKASQEQVHVATIADIKGLVAELNLGGMADLAMLIENRVELKVGDKLYKQSPIPPELAELQRDKEAAMRLVTKTIAEDESIKRENAELRKLLESKVPEGWIPTDEELTKIYNDANGITGGKNPPISTQRIFTAMRAMLSAQPKEPKQ